MTVKQIPLIIPSLEPDDRLPELLKSLKEYGIENIVLLDDGSGPDYLHYFYDAEQMGCTVLRHAVNLGKGRALKDAFNYCLLRWPDAPGCVTADSDGQHTPACIFSVMQALYEHPQDLILGCRDFDDPCVPQKSKTGNKITCTTFRLLVGLNISDTQTGLRGISTAYMKKLLSSNGERFEFESNMLIDTKDAGITIMEVPIQTVYDSKENHTSHFNPIKDSIRIYAIFGKFIVSSLSSSVIDLLCFSFFCALFPAGLFHIGYIFTATILARMISASYNYFMNYKVVFKSREQHVKSSAKYIMLVLFNMVMSSFCVNYLYNTVGGFEVVLKMIVDTLLFLLNYYIQREFVYRSGRKGKN